MIVSSEFSPSGLQVIADAPDRHDPTDAERAAMKTANELEEKDLLVERGWTPADLALARRCGFPAPSIRTAIKRLSFGYQRMAIYSRAAVAQWDADIRGLIGGR